MAVFIGVTDEKQHIFQVFAHVDHGNKGFLTRDELKLALIELFGYKPSKYEVNEIFSKQTNVSTGISRELFYGIIKSKLSGQDQNDGIRQLFLACDTRCHGFITFEDAKSIFQKNAPFIKHFDLQRMFEEVDRDNDGRISYRDFENMIKFSPSE
ncbi:EF-hand calcium-binding domain-containing protein 11-like [Dendronephthya gigantea]|uniref:EF-hand calcium-binding domain-containing protein 11-like n=1 Tax=Dendronephthya gigantea TaxID=151771 RepID=UPI001069CD21|nr:EF-hand calcium-binding domain-containing protein 11-like [Dendronephthya gigantea]